MSNPMMDYGNETINDDVNSVINCPVDDDDVESNGIVETQN